MPTSRQTRLRSDKYNANVASKQRGKVATNVASVEVILHSVSFVSRFMVNCVFMFLC
jgi:hypothetical protein